MRPKGYTAIAVLVTITAIAFILLAVMGFAVIAQKQLDLTLNCRVSQLPRAQAPAAPVDTATWQIYRNEKYRFEMKYPPGWALTDRLADAKYPELELFWAGPAQEPGPSFDDGASLKIFPESRFAGKTIVADDLSTYGQPIPFTYGDWTGFRAGSLLSKENEQRVNAIEANNRSLRLMWLHYDISGNKLTAENYLFPILSTFKFITK